MLFRSKIDWLDYLLVGFGVLLLPVFLIGLLPIGIAVYRIGSKMEKYEQKREESQPKYFVIDEFEIAKTEYFANPTSRFAKIDEYSDDTREEMR